jgi:hypothetical protein
MSIRRVFYDGVARANAVLQNYFLRNYFLNVSRNEFMREYGEFVPDLP